MIIFQHTYVLESFMFIDWFNLIIKLSFSILLFTILHFSLFKWAQIYALSLAFENHVHLWRHSAVSVFPTLPRVLHRFHTFYFDMWAKYREICRKRGKCGDNSNTHNKYWNKINQLYRPIISIVFITSIQTSSLSSPREVTTMLNRTKQHEQGAR